MNHFVELTEINENNKWPCDVGGLDDWYVRSVVYLANMYHLKVRIVKAGHSGQIQGPQAPMGPTGAPKGQQKRKKVSLKSCFKSIFILMNLVIKLILFLLLSIWPSYFTSFLQKKLFLL